MVVTELGIYVIGVFIGIIGSGEGGMQAAKGTVRNKMCSYFVSVRQLSKCCPPPNVQICLIFVKNELMFQMI